MANNQIMTNTWFLVGCALFAVGSIAAIIAGAVAHSAPAIVLGIIVLIVSGALFISGLVDRQHAIKQQRRGVT